MDPATEAVQKLLEHSEVTMWIVTVQLIAAVLMIVVEACLLWGILKATGVLTKRVTPAVDDLIKKIQYLTLKVEVMMEATGLQSATKVLEGEEGDAQTQAKLQQARAEAGLED